MERILRRTNIKVGVLAALSLIFFFSCKKEDPTTPAVPQTYQITVIHCTEGEKNSFSVTATPGDAAQGIMTFNISDLGVSGVDPGWIAYFDKGTNRLRDISRSGSIFITAEKEKTGYDLMVFEELIENKITLKTPKYDWIFDDTPGLYGNKTNHYIYRRDLDNVTEDFNLNIPDPDWQYVIWYFNSEVFDLGWIRRGSLTVNWGSDHSQDDFPYGYAICYDYLNRRVDGLHGGSEGVVVDPERMSSSMARRAIGLAEMFEQLIGVQNFGNRFPSSMCIQTWGVPNSNLRALVNFVYAIKAGNAENYRGGISFRIGK